MESVGDEEGKKLIRRAFKSFGSTNKLTNSICESIKTFLSSWGIKKSNDQERYEHFAAYLSSKRISEQEFVTHITDAAVIKETACNTVDFSKLTKVPLANLQLFETAVGKYVEGEIITSPVVFTASAILIQDEFGEQILVAIYNAIPSNHPKRFELAEAKFPIGSKIRIAEPFYKIFVAGNRGIRVESLTEIQVFNDGEFFDMASIRDKGRTLVTSGDHLGALEVYSEGVSYFTDIVTLLNNRCQTEIRLGEYEEALLDAGAVLFLDEDNDKAQQRYQLASSKLLDSNKEDDNNISKNKQIWQKLLEYSSKAGPIDSTPNGSKDNGNTAFRAGQLEKAKREYTGAINETDICILLNNIAVVCLKTEMFQSAISAANASLRIAKTDLTRKKAVFAMAKAFSMLGELEFSKLSSKGDTSLEDFWSDDRKPIQVLFKILECLPQFDDLGWTKTYSIGVKGNNLPIDYIAPDAMVHKYVFGKGRGLVANRDIYQQEVLIVDRMIKSIKGEDYNEKGFVFAMNTKTRIIETEQQAKLISKFLGLVKHNGLLAKKLLQLESRKHHMIFDDNQLPLIDNLEEMGHRALSYEIPPFLPQTPKQAKVDIGKLTFKFVEAVIGINEFGWEGGSKIPTIGQKGKSLMTRVSLFNHDFEPNCRVFAMGDAMVVVSQKTIKKGEELTILYGEDVTKWEINK